VVDRRDLRVLVAEQVGRRSGACDRPRQVYHGRMDEELHLATAPGVLTVRARLEQPASELGQSLRLVRNVLRLGAELPRIVRPTGVELTFARPIADKSALHMDVRLIGSSAGAVAKTLDVTNHVIDIARSATRRFPTRDLTVTPEVEELLELAEHASVRPTGPALRTRMAEQWMRIVSTNGVSTILEAANRGLSFTTRSWRRLDSGSENR
jgi:hypothetical protein